MVLKGKLKLCCLNMEVHPHSLEIGYEKSASTFILHERGDGEAILYKINSIKIIKMKTFQNDRVLYKCRKFIINLPRIIDI